MKPEQFRRRSYKASGSRYGQIDVPFTVLEFVRWDKRIVERWTYNPSRDEYDLLAKRVFPVGECCAMYKV